MIQPGPAGQPVGLFYCWAREHTTFISVQTRRTLSETSTAALGCAPLCAEDTSRCDSLSPSALTLMPAIWSPFVNWISRWAGSFLVIVMPCALDTPRTTAAYTLSAGA